MGDIFMSLIHTCELNQANPFDYLTAFIRHSGDVATHPPHRLPWNYRQSQADLPSAT
ncbi:transposase domain-containing protein [Thalassoroseus pseudoceratinae]|uniref:transposase domain-containing protein n=1 Tax=Thalassoroseus pseudoceratinae TaxID=2713176 RepID=UPI00141E9648|nr:transposase domain-containing protein [Thalassoroseus pseudoceratinae]